MDVFPYVSFWLNAERPKSPKRPQLRSNNQKSGHFLKKLLKGLTALTNFTEFWALTGGSHMDEYLYPYKL